MTAEQYHQNKQDVFSEYYDEIFVPKEAIGRDRTEACEAMLSACVCDLELDTPIYHYISFDYFMKMLAKEALHLSRANPFSPLDEDLIFPDRIKNMISNVVISLSQFKNTVYVKCFSLESDSDQLWDKASQNGFEDCVCFKTTPRKIFKAIVSPSKGTRSVAYDFLKMQYKKWADFCGCINASVSINVQDLMARRYESLSTLPSTDANGQPTSYPNEKEVRLVYDKSKREFSSPTMWHPVANFDFIDDVRVFPAGNVMTACQMIDSIVNGGNIPNEIIHQR